MEHFDKTVGDFVLSDDGNTIIKYVGTSSEVTIPLMINNIPITSIGVNAFSEISNITKIIFPPNSNITSIGYEAFRSCSNLKSINLPNSITNIGNGTFNGCLQLTNITFEGDINNININASFFTSSGSVTVYNSIEWDTSRKINLYIYKLII